MAFINIPVFFIEENEFGLSPTSTKGVLNINTKLICSYNEMDNKNTIVRLANGDYVEVNLKEKDFEKILGAVESIVDLGTLVSN